MNLRNASRQPREINLYRKIDGRTGTERDGNKEDETDIGLFYEDDFRETDEIIKKRLSKKNDKGISAAARTAGNR